MTRPPSPRLVFVNRVYWPDESATAQLLTDLAAGLAARGHRVSVVCSGSHDETHAGVDLIRIRTPAHGSRSLIGKALNYLGFFVGSLWRLNRLLRAGDTMILMTDPPLLAAAAAPLAARRGTRVIHWVQDVHPEVVLALRPRSALLRLALRPWQAWRNRAWRRANRCVAISRQMAHYLRDMGVPAACLSVVENWAGASLAQPADAEKVRALRHAWNLTGQFVVAYSGNLGRVHHLQPLIDTAVRLRGEPGIMFQFIGHGPRRAELERAAAQHQLTNVAFRPPQPRLQLAEALAIADLHVIALHPGCEMFVHPSKLYGILAAGRPVLFIGAVDSELATFLRAQHCGLAFSGDSADEMASAIRALAKNPARVSRMGAAAREAFVATGGLENALLQWEEILRPPPA